MNNHSPLRLGLVGSSKIVEKSVLMPISQISDIVIGGVSSRDVSKQAYGSSYKYYESFDAMLSDQDIDAVYIPIPNTLHKEFIVRALEAKKHVLVEKPFCLNRNELEEILCHAEDSKRVVHEALMTQHHEWPEKLSNIILEQKYGRLLKVISYFYSNVEKSPTNYRFKKALGGGCFYDFSPYWIHFLQKTVGLQPEKIVVNSKIDPNYNIDTEVEIKLEYRGCEAAFYASFDKPFKASHQLVFENCTLEIKNFLRPMLGYHKFYFDLLDAERTVSRIEFSEQNYYHNQLDTFKKLCDGAVPPKPFYNELLERTGFMEKISNFIN